jgi:hypothetical protein
MKFKFIFVFFLILSNSNCTALHTDPQSYQALSNAIKIISEEIISEYTLVCNLIYTSNNYEVNAFRETFMKTLMGGCKLRTRQQQSSYIEPLTTKNYRKFSVFCIQKFLDFEKIYTKIDARNFQHHGYYIIVLINGKIDEIEIIFEKLWEIHIFNVIIIFEDINEHLQIFTFFPFRSSTDCSNTTPVLINKFVNQTFTEGIENIFPSKMTNLQQCEVKVATSDSKPPYIFKRISRSGKEKFSGRDFELLSVLSHNLNFKVNFTLLSEFGCILERNGKDGVMKHLEKNKSDIAIVDCWLRLARLELFDATTTYFYEKVVMVFPMEPELSSFRKMFYPLAIDSWIMLVSYLAVGVLSIFFINFLSRKIQNFVIGEHVKYPYMNMLIGIVGQAQNKIPSTNFARFLLMNFLLFSLVIRTAYQGKLYQVMKSEIKFSEPKSINEMSERGYKFFVLTVHTDVVHDLSKFTVV